MVQSDFEIKDIHYYFEGIRRDILDSGSLDSIFRRWFVLRDRLLTLPPDKAHSVLEIVEGMIHSQSLDAANASQNKEEEGGIGADLYRAVRATGNLTTPKVE